LVRHIKFMKTDFFKKKFKIGDRQTLYLYGGTNMVIDTTANIDVKTYRTIKETAKMLKVPGRRLVHILLKLAVREKPFRYRQFMAVEYQADMPKEF